MEKSIYYPLPNEIQILQIGIGEKQIEPIGIY